MRMVSSNEPKVLRTYVVEELVVEVVETVVELELLDWPSLQGC